MIGKHDSTQLKHALVRAWCVVFRHGRAPVWAVERFRPPATARGTVTTATLRRNGGER
jgi:hypothetical protein